MKKNKTYNLNLFLIVLFIITGGTLTFGFSFYNFSVPLPFFRLTDSFIIISYLLFNSFIINKVKIYYRKSVLKYYYYFLLLLLFIALKNIILLEVDLSEIVKKSTSIYIIIFIFPLIILVKNKKQILIIINALYFIALISSFVYLFQFSTGIELEASTGAFYDGVYRINHPGIPIITLVFFLTMSHLLVYGFKINYLFYYLVALVSLIIIIITLSRGYILAVIISTIFMFYRAFFHGSGSTFIRGSFLIGIIGVVILVYKLQDTSIFDKLTTRIEEGVTEVSTQKGTFDTRYEMIINKISYIASNNPLLGVGFSYHTAKSEEESLSSEFYFHPTTLNGDSTYQNIVIISGFIGLFLWLMNLYYLNKKSSKLYINSKDKFVRFLALSSSILPIFIFLHGFTSSYFSNLGLLLLSLSLSFAFYAENLNKLEH